MKRLLLPLIAALALPTAVSAYTVSQKYYAAQVSAASWCRMNKGWVTKEEGTIDLLKLFKKKRISIEIMKEKDVKMVSNTIWSVLDEKCLIDKSKIPSGRSFESRMKGLLNN